MLIVPHIDARVPRPCADRPRSCVFTEDHEPIVARDFGGVHSIEQSGVTLALFADELCQ